MPVQKPFSMAVACLKSGCHITPAAMLLPEVGRMIGAGNASNRQVMTEWPEQSLTTSQCKQTVCYMLGPGKHHTRQDNAAHLTGATGGRLGGGLSGGGLSGGGLSGGGYVAPGRVPETAMGGTDSGGGLSGGGGPEAGGMSGGGLYSAISFRASQVLYSCG